MSNSGILASVIFTIYRAPKLNYFEDENQFFKKNNLKIKKAMNEFQIDLKINYSFFQIIQR